MSDELLIQIHPCFPHQRIYKDKLKAIDLFRPIIAIDIRLILSEDKWRHFLEGVSIFNSVSATIDVLYFMILSSFIILFLE